MSENQYTSARAAATLHREGLLHGVYLPFGGGLLAGGNGAPDFEAIPGGFLGAGLDNRVLADGELFVALAGEHNDGRRFAAAALKSGHWVLTRPADGADELAGLTGEAGVLLSGDPETALAVLARTWRAGFALPVVGVTGSNGKTTTKDFITTFLSAAGRTCATTGNLNNRLGLPLTLLRLRKTDRFAVIEMGASAEGHIAHLASLARPTVAVITNAAPAHLAEFGSLDGVILGKGEILDLLPEDGRAVLNADSPGYRRWLDRASCPVVTFGQTEGDYLWAWCPDGESGGPEITLNDETWPVPLPGVHNGANLVAAILATRAVGVGDPQIKEGLAGFQISEHRSRQMDIAGRTILDDAYNANPVSMAAAAEAVADLPGSGRVLAVLGHMAELGPESEDLHRSTGLDLAAGRLDILITVGKLAAPLAEGFGQGGGQHIPCLDIGEASDWLLAHWRRGDRILIKGSRSAGMERLIPLLEQFPGDKEKEE